MDSCNNFHEMMIHSTLNKKWLQLFGGLTRAAFEKIFLGTTLSWITTIFHDLLFCQGFCISANDFRRIDCQWLRIDRVRAFS